MLLSLALAAWGVSYPYRSAKLSDLVILHRSALRENIYALYGVGHACHLRDGVSRRVGPALVRATNEVVYPDLGYACSSFTVALPPNKVILLAATFGASFCPQVFQASENERNRQR